MLSNTSSLWNWSQLLKLQWKYFSTSTLNYRIFYVVTTCLEKPFKCNWHELVPETRVNQHTLQQEFINCSSIHSANSYRALGSKQLLLHNLCAIFIFTNASQHSFEAPYIFSFFFFELFSGPPISLAYSNILTFIIWRRLKGLVINVSSHLKLRNILSLMCSTWKPFQHVFILMSFVYRKIF